LGGLWQHGGLGAASTDRTALETAFMFGYTEEQVTAFGMSFGVGAFMLYMRFIIGQLAWESKAGKFGTMVMFIGLALGMTGFVAKYLIKYFIDVK